MMDKSPYISNLIASILLILIGCATVQTVGTSSRVGSSSVSKIFYEEKFADKEVGDVLDNWGPGVVVNVGASGAKYIKLQNGRQTVSREVAFPDSFIFEFEIFGRTGSEDLLAFEDKYGESLVISILNTAYRDVFKMNDLIEADIAPHLGNISRFDKWNQIKITSRDDTYKVFYNNKFAVSGKYTELNEFVRFSYTADAGRCLRGFRGTGM